MCNRLVEGLRSLGGLRGRAKAWKDAGASHRAETIRLLELSKDCAERLSTPVNGAARCVLESQHGLKRLTRDCAVSYAGAERGQLVGAQIELIALPSSEEGRLSWDCAGPVVRDLYLSGVLTEPGPPRLEASSLRQYTDPKLKRGRELTRLVVRLWHCGLVRPIQNCLGESGITMFVVAKSATKQRLIFYMRRKNGEFAKPPSCVLSSLESIAALDLDDGEYSAFCGDIPNMFYRLGTPWALHERFWLVGTDVGAIFEAMRLTHPDFACGSQVGVGSTGSMPSGRSATASSVCMSRSTSGPWASSIAALNR